MTDNPSPTSTVEPPEAVLTNGHLLLVEARQAAGMPLDALSLALKVPVKRLESLEAGRYDELPDMTFARALAMSVCRYLHIDAREVLERMPLAHADHLGPKGVVGGDTMYTTGEGLALSPVSVLRRPPVLVALALVLAAALLYSLPEATDPAPVDAAPAAEPATVPASEVPAAPLPAPTAVTESSAEPAVVPVAPSPSVPVAAPPAPATLPIEPAAAPVAPNRSVVLRVTAQNETWLQVIRPDGTVLMDRLIQTGDVVDMGTAPPYTLVLGRASAAQVFVRGQAIPLAPHTRGDVARYEVK
jgi:cytoskeleton protein RodZ